MAIWPLVALFFLQTRAVNDLEYETLKSRLDKVIRAKKQLTQAPFLEGLRELLYSEPLHQVCNGTEEGYNRWEHLLELQLRPEELDYELGTLSQCARKEAILFVNALAWSLQTQLDLYHSTHNDIYSIVKHFGRKLAPKTEGETMAALLHHERPLVEALLLFKKSLLWIEKDKWKGTIQWDAVNEVGKHSPRLQRLILEYIVGLLAIDPKARLGELEEYDKKNSDKASLVQQLRRAQREWSSKVFREVISLNKAEHIMIEIDKKKEGDNVDSINHLMNLAFVKSNGPLEQEKCQATTLVALVINKHRPQSGSLLKYYRERKDKHPPCDLVGLSEGEAFRSLISKLERALDTLEQREKALWRPETDNTELLSASELNKAEAHRLEVSLKNSIEAEESMVPSLMDRLPKYWVNRYLLCHLKGDLGCGIFLCAASTTDSQAPLYHYAWVGCRETIFKGLIVHFPSQLTSAEKIFLFRVQVIKEAKLEDTRKFVKRLYKDSLLRNRLAIPV